MSRRPIGERADGHYRRVIIVVPFYALLLPPFPSAAATAAVPGATLIHDWPIVVRASIKSANVDAVDASRCPASASRRCVMRIKSRLLTRGLIAAE